MARTYHTMIRDSTYTMDTVSPAGGITGERRSIKAGVLLRTHSHVPTQPYHHSSEPAVADSNE